MPLPSYPAGKRSFALFLPAMSTSVRSTASRAQPPAAAVHGWRLAERHSQNRWTSTFRAHPAGNSAAADFVIKRARPDLTTDGERDLARGLLAREAAVSQQVRHPHLATTLAVEWHGDDVWLLQPLARAALASAGNLDLPVKLWVIRQTAQALAALHEAGWLHGNVAPEAIVVGPTGHATLGELGWCRRLASDECDLSRTAFMGQIRYAAPETFDDAGMLTPAADVYSLGAVLIELLTGRPLLAQYDGPELIAAKRLLAAAEIHSAGIPFDVSSLAARMLRRDPLKRPTAAEVVDGLIAAEIATFA